MTSKQIAIIGLGTLAASMGLALRNARQDLVVVGTDRDWGLATRMQKLGAVDRLERRPATACREAGLIIIAEPLQEMPVIFDAIAADAPAGSVVTDIAPLKTDVMHWAHERLPEHVYFIGGHPLVMARSDEPRADLLVGAQYCLVPASNVPEQAVDVVSGLVSVVGAQPYFLDAAEHDGLMAAVEELPHMLQLALMAALSRAGSWRDNQRAVGRAFVEATSMLEEDPALSVYAHRRNRRNLALWIESVQEALSYLEDILSAEDETALQKHVTDLCDTRRRWLKDRDWHTWDAVTPPVEVDKRSIFSKLFLPEFRKPDRKPDQ